MKTTLLSTLFLFALAASLQAQIKTRYVKPSATGNGTSWANAGDLQSIINGSASGDSVFVAGGTYLPAESFSMKEGVKIYGSFTGTEASLSQRRLATNIAAGKGSVLKGNENTVIYNNGNKLTQAAVLDGFTISGGKGSSGGYGYGGGMFNDSYSSPTLSNIIFINNSSAGGGGGMFNNSYSSPTLTNVFFVNNSVSNGYGGGMNNNNHCSPTLTNVAFIGNTSDHPGGAMENTVSSPTLINVTFSGNSAGTIGGGGMDNYSNSSPRLTNCIFWGNTGTSGPDIYQEDGSSTITYSYTQTHQSGTGNKTGTTNPFINSSNPAGADDIYGTADDGLELVNASAAIDAGDPQTNTTGYSIQAGNADIAGNKRVTNSHIDMGAYEYNSTTLPVTLINFSVSLKNDLASLHWRTGVETNFNHFEIQKSTDGSSFQPEGETSAKGDNSDYLFTLPQLEPTAYYRLKIVDNDAKNKYSDVVVAMLQNENTNSTLVYPNPARDYINFKLDKAGIIFIYDESGVLVKTAALQASVNKINISNFQAGAYYGEVNGTKLSFVKQ